MTETAKDQIAETIAVHRRLVAELADSGAETIIAFVDAIVKSIQNGGTIYICGNGGSAADAQHIAGELVGRFKADRRALPAVAITTDTSILTCIGNDYSFDDVFARQVEALVKKSDVLWAFSTSGTSSNVIKAVELAKQRAASILAFTGRAESTLEKLADICFCVDDESTARSQEVHQLTYHIICDLVEQAFVDG